MIVALFILAGAAAVLWKITRPESQLEGSFKKGSIEIVTTGGTRTLDVEFAISPEEHRHGLMFRTGLAENTGMLFLYSKPDEVRMWMKNTYIPLDMVFIRADGAVHRVEAHTQPHSERVIDSRGPVAGVLEIAGGAAERLEIKPGDKVLHPHFKP